MGEVSGLSHSVFALEFDCLRGCGEGGEGSNRILILIFNKTIKSFYWSRVSGSVASPPKNAVNIFLWRVLVQETNPLFPAGKKRFRLKAGRLKAF